MSALSTFQAALQAVPLIGILRGWSTNDAMAAAGTAHESGITAFEVTLDSPNALSTISLLRERLPGATIGAGTVLSAADAVAAANAGAAFLVAPNFDPAVVQAVNELGIPWVVGALTPTEVAIARRAGPAMVKVFPAGPLGAAHITALRGPWPDVPLLATGGIQPDEARAFLRAGATAVGLGSALFANDGPDQLRKAISALLADITAGLKA